MLLSLDLGAPVTMLGCGFVVFDFESPGRFADFKRPHTLRAAGSLGGGERCGAVSRRESLLRRFQIRGNEKEVF